MRTFGGKTIVVVDKVYDDEIELGGNKLWVDRSFANKDWHRKISGVVVSSTLVPDGSKVYFHYLETNKPQASPNNYVMDDARLFCYVDSTGQIQMLNDFVLIDPIQKESISTLLYVPDNEKVYNDRGVVAVIGENDIELVPGDKVLLMPNSNFTNEIEGKEYFVVRHDDIIAVFNDTESLDPHDNSHQ